MKPASKNLSFLTSVNGEYIAHLYAQYIKNKSSVDASWQSFFSGLSDSEIDVLREQHGASWTPEDNRLESAGFGKPSSGNLNVVSMDTPQRQPVSDDQLENTVRVHNLINAYRVYGHCLANLDPLGLTPPPGHPALEISHHRLTDASQNTVFNLMGKLGLQHATLSQVLQQLKTIYGGNSGAEFMHIPDRERQNWVQKAFENRGTLAVETAAERKHILKRLADAEGFEQFLHKKFQGAKRFGADGAESTIPALDAIVEHCVKDGANEFVFGMAHRGRLNVLTNILGKSFTAVLAEFQGKNALPESYTNVSSDVKYHMGYSNDHEVAGKTVHMSLAYNPSHLEFVNAVVVGKARAKQHQKHDTDGTHVVPILIHGDAAFAGQGVVAETLMMSQLEGYKVGGTIHIIINNQVGFTTRPEDSRSGMYSSDVAKMIDAPILHVNGDDPEEVVRLARIAAEYRQTFQADIVLDIVCYRRYGHNEGDEPLFTQPVMYKTIAARPPVRALYADKLIAENALSQEESESYVADISERMNSAFEASASYAANDSDVLQGSWKGITTAPSEMPRRASTGIDEKLFDQIGKAITSVPEGFDLNSKIRKQLDAKAEMFNSGKGFDWGTAEALAYGSLLSEGYNVRLSGQDCRRGTFSHRHAEVTDQTTDQRYAFLDHVSEKQGDFEVYDSPLSECAVMGYEYGYSLASPNTLTMWEGQFGDFVNGAQVILDQFIASGESKWLRMSGLTLLLPHSFEGQGPEHSSARLERFLQNCAEDNWQVVYPTTPANYFHLLRRQMHRNFRKPLIVMSPKSLLRHKLCVSFKEDMVGQTGFRRVFWDHAKLDNALAGPKDIKRIVLCSGKVYYDLFEARAAAGIKNVQFLRVEQLYPFPADALEEELAQYPNAEVIWCQEEPQNQGAWTFMEPRLRQVLAKIKHKAKEAVYVGRPEASAPATGLMTRHKQEQEALINAALKL